MTAPNLVLLSTRYFSGGLPPLGGETAIIGMLAPLGMLVIPLTKCP